MWLGAHNKARRAKAVSQDAERAPAMRSPSAWSSHRHASRRATAWKDGVAWRAGAGQGQAAEQRADR